MTILPPAFVRFILTAKPSALVRRLPVGFAVALPPASPKEQDKGKCVTGGRGIVTTVLFRILFSIKNHFFFIIEFVCEKATH